MNNKERIYLLITYETKSDPDGKEIQEYRLFYDKTLALYEKKSLKKSNYYDLIILETYELNDGVFELVS